MRAPLQVRWAPAPKPPPFSPPPPFGGARRTGRPQAPTGPSISVSREPRAAVAGPADVCACLCCLCVRCRHRGKIRLPDRAGANKMHEIVTEYRPTSTASPPPYRAVLELCNDSRLEFSAKKLRQPGSCFYMLGPLEKTLTKPHRSLKESQIASDNKAAKTILATFTNNRKRAADSESAFH